MLIQAPFYKKLLTKERDEKIFYQFKLGVGLALSSLISLLTWLMFLYADGSYYICQKSDWDGVWSYSGQETSHFLCGTGRYYSLDVDERKVELSSSWFIESQDISTGLFIGVALFVLLLTIFMLCVGKDEKPHHRKAKEEAEKVCVNLH